MRKMGQANNDQVEQSHPLITVNEEGQLIFLSRFEDRNTVKELLPQSRWLPNIKAWKLPNITDDNFKSFQKMFELFPFTQEAHEVLGGFEDRIRIFQDQIKTAWEIKSFEASMLTGVLPVKVKPYDHQIKAFEFAKTLDHSALLMEQGTGKTLVAIALAGHWYQQGEIKRVLVICPKTVMPEWERQFLEVANYPYRLEILTGSIEDRTNTLKNWPSNEDGLQVAVINYEATWRLEKELKAWDPDLVIADESQKIKNGRAEQTKAVTALGKQAKHRLILTGTPVTQSPLDVFSQYRFLDPRIFGYRFIPFRDRYAVMGGYGGYQIISYRNLEELAEKAHSIAFRATKKECLDLPDTIDQFVYAELEPEAWKLYEQMAEEAIIKLSETEQVTAPIILTELLRLQQIAGGFVSTSPNNQIHQISKAKLEAIRELLEELKENNKQVVIFARFIPEIKAITELVKDLGMSSFTLTGETTTENRGKGIAEFQKGNIQVVISQISTGGLGITLTAADTAIFYSTDFSLANYEQAKARLHRIEIGRAHV
jgi:SNF2 family DNA or RNA helicase